MPTPPPSITPAPQPPPQRGDRATFSDRVDRWVTWMSAVPADFQAVANNVYANALEASAAITAIPPITGNATKSLRVNAAGTAMEWVQDGAALGFTPVQQGGGVGQDSVKVNIGRGTGTGALKATISGTDIGYLATSSTDPATALTAPAFVGNGAGLTGFTAAQINTALGYTAASVANLADGTTPIGFKAAGANAIQRTTQEKLREIVSITDYPSLKDAINALPASGGVVEIPAGRFPAGAWKFDTAYMSKANVTLRGKKMPMISANCDRLEGGSVIEGRFNVYADNFSVENLGFDLGKYVVDTYFGGLDTHSADYPGGDTWDAFAFAQPSQSTPLRGRFNFYANNVIGLSRDSQSLGHSVLIEGVNGGYVNNVIGVGGVHALVFKSKNINGGHVAGYCASSDNVIIKSDSYATCGDIRLANVHAGGVPPGIAPWYTPAVAQWALLLNPSTDNLGPVHIGALTCTYAQELIASAGSATPEGEPLYSISGFKVENAECDGAGITGGGGLALKLANFYRPIIDTLVINNCDFPVTYDQRTAAGGANSFPLSINNLVIGGTCNSTAVQVLNFGQVVVDSLTYFATGAVGLYDISDTGRLSVGNNTVRGAYGVVFIRNAPTLTTGWSANASSPFRVTLANYGVAVHGLVTPGVGSSGTICTMPSYLRTKYAVRLSTIGKDSVGAIKPLILNVDPNYGFLGLNDGGASVAGAENYVSLDGTGWGFN